MRWSALVSTIVICFFLSVNAQNYTDDIFTFTINVRVRDPQPASPMTANYMFWCVPDCSLFDLQGFPCYDNSSGSNCGFSYDFDTYEFPYQLRWGRALSDYGPSGLGWRILPPRDVIYRRLQDEFTVVQMAHWNYPIEYSTSLTGFTLDVDLNVVSTFGDNATKNFAYQIKFEETPDICIVHGGVNSLGCPWNDPASWDNTTETNLACVSDGPFSYKLPNGDSCCPFLSVQKPESPAGCADKFTIQDSYDPRYAAAADGDLLLANTSYTLLLKGTQPSGRLDSEKKWVVSDEKQRTDFDFIAQLVFNCPPADQCPGGGSSSGGAVFQDLPMDGACWCACPASMQGPCPGVQERAPTCECLCPASAHAKCLNGGFADNSSPDCPCDCSAVTCPGRRTLNATSCDCYCDRARCQNGAPMDPFDDMCTCDCIKGYCQAVSGAAYVEDEFCNCVCPPSVQANCTGRNRQYTPPGPNNVGGCSCDCASTNCPAPKIFDPLTCQCDCPQTSQRQLTQCDLNHNVFDLDTCQCDDTRCQGNWAWVHTTPPMTSGPCMWCEIAPETCTSIGRIWNNRTCQCDCPNEPPCQPPTPVDVNCGCMTCSANGHPLGIGYCVCGNGVVEDGEDCDPGPGGFDSAECCEPLTCKWRQYCLTPGDPCNIATCVPVDVPGRTAGPGRECVHINPCNQSGDCFTQTCEVQGNSYRCVDQPKPDAPCGGNNKCVQRCQGRQCVFQPPSCPDSIALHGPVNGQCYEPSCDPATGVCVEVFQTGRPCSPGNLTSLKFPDGDCWTGVCHNGACQEVFLEGRACLPSDLADRVGAVNLQCYSGRCAAGTCQLTPLIGQPCVDGLSCTYDPSSLEQTGQLMDRCEADDQGSAVCRGSATPCDLLPGSRDCNDITCEETASGYYCRFVPRPYLTPCSDGLACTINDVCQQARVLDPHTQQMVWRPVGICAGELLLCPDSNSSASCLANTCVETENGTAECQEHPEPREGHYCTLEGPEGREETERNCTLRQCRAGSCVIVSDWCEDVTYNRSALIAGLVVALVALLLLAVAIAIFTRYYSSKIGLTDPHVSDLTGQPNTRRYKDRDLADQLLNDY